MGCSGPPSPAERDLPWGFEAWDLEFKVYRVTSLIRNCFLLGPCSWPMPRSLWWS